MEKDKETRDAIKVFYSKVKEPHNQEEAAALAMDVAVKQNPTYSIGVDHREIRDYWRKVLIALLPKYQQAKPVRVSVFIRDVKKIKIKMNSQFPEAFNNTGRAGDYDFDKEFRIAHAQKSLSIFLKHMWCITDNMPEPPVCPIDGRILKAIKNNGTWTKLNNTATYKTYIKLVRNIAKAKNMSLAKWELVVWNQPLVPINTNIQYKAELGTSKTIKEDEWVAYKSFGRLKGNTSGLAIVKNGGCCLPLKNLKGNIEQYRIFVAKWERKTKKGMLVDYICKLMYEWGTDYNIDIDNNPDALQIFKAHSNVEWIKSNVIKSYKYVKFGKDIDAAIGFMNQIIEEVKIIN